MRRPETGGTLRGFWYRAITAPALAVCFCSTAHSQTEFYYCSPQSRDSAKLESKNGLKISEKQREALNYAQGILRESPLTVTAKPSLPPSKDPHDYFSIGIYLWPDPTRPEGKPWISRDGVINKDLKTLAPDADRMQTASSWVRNLAYAYTITRDEKYAAQAAKVLRAWFIAPNTRMNPHLQFGQSWPGRTNGSPWGIIETWPHVDLPDAVRMLRGSESWTASDHSALKNWFSRYSQWLQESELGKRESQARNNHASWYDTQLATFLAFAGRQGEALMISQRLETRIAEQISPEGRQPEELKRTRPLQYSVFNLEALTRSILLKSRLENRKPSLTPKIQKALRLVANCLRIGKHCNIPKEAPGTEPFRMTNALRLFKRVQVLTSDGTYSDLVDQLERAAAGERWDSSLLCLEDATSPLF